MPINLIVRGLYTQDPALFQLFSGRDDKCSTPNSYVNWFLGEMTNALHQSFMPTSSW